MMTGLDVLKQFGFGRLKHIRLAVLANQASIDVGGNHILGLLSLSRVKPTLVLSPEHGLWGTHQDMESVPHHEDPVFRLPIVSLYGRNEASLAPETDLLTGLDLLLADLQDVGARYYTFAATVLKCLRVSQKTGTTVVVLDRPNPINGVDIEGGIIDPSLRSYVGEIDVPQRHGLTLGELILLASQRERLEITPIVVPTVGWDRTHFFRSTSLPWTPPSPNMPTPETAVVYPGLCLLEGTNLSEGRGTTTPFELFGAPWIDPHELRNDLLAQSPHAGCTLVETAFRPSFGKWTGEVCKGLRIHVGDPGTFRSLALGLAILKSVCRLYPDRFRWRTETYEFIDSVPAIDLLLGKSHYRTALESGESIDDILSDMNRASLSYVGERNELLASCEPRRFERQLEAVLK